jgi:tRNA pseudouridine38-40 synthase
MRVLKLTIAYDGTGFVGWQRQAGGESIQQLLEESLGRFEGSPVTVHGAGRTDAGVHALGQVASVGVTFSHPTDVVRRALNAQLPEAIRVLEVVDAAPDFHARFAARSKTYRYHIRAGTVGDPFARGFVWQLDESLDIAAMRTAAAALVGTHDFSVFQSVGTEVASTVRTIVRSEFCGGVATPGSPNPGNGEGGPGSGQTLVYEVTADGFLRHMVRAIVGTLVEIGRGWRSAESMAQLIDSGRRAHAGATAPAHGLFLVRVDYD